MLIIVQSDFFLDRQRNRLQAADAIANAKAIADSGDLDKAKSVIQRCMDDIQESLSGKDELCSTLLSDLTEAKDGMKSKNEYYEKGSKKMAWKAQAHEKERAVGKGGYSTNAKVAMKQKVMSSIEPPQPLFVNKPTLNKKIEIGNEHTELTGAPQTSLPVRGQTAQHKWKMFVRGENLDDIIEKVIFELHPTFQPPKVTLTQSPFEVERVGWGYFDVTVKIYFKPEAKKTPCEFVHTLCFEGNGKSKEIVI